MSSQIAAIDYPRGKPYNCMDKNPNRWTHFETRARRAFPSRERDAFLSPHTVIRMPALSIIESWLSSCLGAEITAVLVNLHPMNISGSIRRILGNEYSFIQQCKHGIRICTYAWNSHIVWMLLGCILLRVFRDKLCLQLAATPSSSSLQEVLLLNIYLIRDVLRTIRLQGQPSLFSQTISSEKESNSCCLLIMSRPQAI